MRPEGKFSWRPKPRQMRGTAGERCRSIGDQVSGTTAYACGTRGARCWNLSISDRKLGLQTLDLKHPFCLALTPGSADWTCFRPGPIVQAPTRFTLSLQEPTRIPVISLTCETGGGTSVQFTLKTSGGTPPVAQNRTSEPLRVRRIEVQQTTCIHNSGGVFWEKSCEDLGWVPYVQWRSPAIQSGFPFHWRF